MYILRYMGSKSCVEFQRVPLKFHTKFWTHTPQNVHFTDFYICLWFTIFLDCDVISLRAIEVLTVMFSNDFFWSFRQCKCFLWLLNHHYWRDNGLAGHAGRADCHYHHSDVIMTTIASQITSLMIVTQFFIQTQIKENIKAPRHWPLCGEFTGDRWIPRTKGQ